MGSDQDVSFIRNKFNFPMIGQSLADPKYFDGSGKYEIVPGRPTALSNTCESEVCAAAARPPISYLGRSVIPIPRKENNPAQ